VADAERLYLMAPDGQPVDPAFVRLAVEQDVRHIVLLSSMSIEAMGDERLLAAERTVRACGVDWTILLAGWFHHNFDEGFFHPAVLAGEPALPLGEVRQVFVDADDIAAAALAALTQDGHGGHTDELTGPRALSFAEALEIISRASGRPVRFRGQLRTTWPPRPPWGCPRSRPDRSSRRSRPCGRLATPSPPAWFGR
jgi:uncharacterized protein YbjT (DUF2867 family)